MNQAWKLGQRTASPVSSRTNTPVNQPKPSPQQTPGKPRSTSLTTPSKSLVEKNTNHTKGSNAAKPGIVGKKHSTSSPWDEALGRGKTSALHNKPLLKQTSKLATEMAGLFSLDEITRLGKRFKKLDKDSSGSLSLEEFVAVPELHGNPLVQRVVEIFDIDRNGEVDFKEFIEGISHFTVTGNKDKRLRFAFRIYDINNDGFISNGELFQVMKMMVGTSMSDTQLQHIVDTTIILGDKDEDGKISFTEFNDLVNTSTDIHKKMIIEGI